VSILHNRDSFLFSSFTYLARTVDTLLKPVYADVLLSLPPSRRFFSPLSFIPWFWGEVFLDVVSSDILLGVVFSLCRSPFFFPYNFFSPTRSGRT